MFSIIPKSVPWGEVSTSVKEKSHKDSSQAIREAKELQECFYWPKARLLKLLCENIEWIFFEIFKNFPVKVFIEVWSWGRSSLWTTPCTSKKQISMHFMFDFAILAFLGLGVVEVCQIMFQRLICGSYSNIHHSSDIMTRYWKWWSFSIESTFSSWCSAGLENSFLEAFLHFSHLQFICQNLINGSVSKI